MKFTASKGIFFAENAFLFTDLVFSRILLDIYGRLCYNQGRIIPCGEDILWI